MRAFNLFAIFAIGFALVACAHNRPMPIKSAPVGIERSVLPIFVTGYSRSEKQVPTRNGFKTVTFTDFRSCSAVYVAPHLLATSASVFPMEHVGVTMYDPDSIAILDGTAWLSAKDIPFFDPETGLVLIRTYQAGVPLTLWDGSLTPTDALKRIGHTFRLGPGVFATPSWDVGPATSNDAIDSLFSTTMFRARTDLSLGSCGSAIVRHGGTLVGIINRRIGDNEATIIAPASIRAAIESVEDTKE